MRIFQLHKAKTNKPLIDGKCPYCGSEIELKKNPIWDEFPNYSYYECPQCGETWTLGEVEE